jgi:CBS domain-containing protein
MKVRDVMITDVITITPEATIEEVAALAEQRKGVRLYVSATGGIRGALQR